MGELLAPSDFSVLSSLDDPAFGLLVNTTD